MKFTHVIIEPIRRGVITIATLFLASKLLIWLLALFFGFINPLRTTVLYLIGSDNFWIGTLIAVMILLPICWLVGQFSISNIFFFLFKRKAQKESGKYLQVARIKNKNFYMGCGIGLVTKKMEIDGKTHYNICFPNLGGFITLSKVPEEEVELTGESVVNTLLFYLSCGSL